MTNPYSKTINKQRVDFYLEKIQKLCIDSIDNDDQAVPSLTILGLIRHSIDRLEIVDQECNRKRKLELENIMSELRSPSPLSSP